jgi:chromosome segregation ATPase
VVNPQWRRLDSQLRSKIGQRHRLHAQFGAIALSQGLSPQDVEPYQQRKGELQEQIQHLDAEIEGLKQQRKQTDHHIAVSALPQEERFTRLRTERKHFLDTIKMIAYRAETSLVSTLRDELARADDARALIRQIFETEADLLPDPTRNTLTVGLHHLTQAAHDQVLEKLCATLNETQTVFPGTNLVMIFKVGSSQIPPTQEI